MDAKKTNPLQTRGGRIALLIASIMTLLAVGIGTAFAAEGGISGVLKDVTDFVTGGFGAKGSVVDTTSSEPYTITVDWDDYGNQYATRPDHLDFDIMDPYETHLATITVEPDGDGVWTKTKNVPRRYVDGAAIRYLGVSIDGIPSHYSNRGQGTNSGYNCTLDLEGIPGYITSRPYLNINTSGGPLPESVTFTLTSNTSGTVIASKTVSLSDDHVAILKDTYGETYQYRFLFLTPADNIPSQPGETYRMEVTADDYSTGSGTVYDGEYGASGSFWIDYDPVISTTPWTISVVWDDNSSTSRPESLSVRCKPNQSGVPDRFSPSITVTANDSWTQTVDLADEWIGSPLSYDFSLSYLPPVTQKLIRACQEALLGEDYNENDIPDVENLYQVDVSVDRANHTATITLSADEDAFVDTTSTLTQSFPYWVSKVRFVWDDAGHEGERPETVAFSVYDGGTQVGKQNVPTRNVLTPTVLYPNKSNNTIVVEQPDGYRNHRFRRMRLYDRV